jgi:hypothetical protein
LKIWSVDEWGSRMAVNLALSLSARGRSDRSGEREQVEPGCLRPRSLAAAVELGAKDHTVPTAIGKASFKKEKKNPGVTEYVELEGRGQALTIDEGWQQVAETALAFVRRFA